MKVLVLGFAFALLISPGLRAQQQESPAARPTLATLVGELRSNNPDLGVARAEIAMRVARIAPAGTPPDPTLLVGYMSGFARPPFFPSSSTPEAFRQIGVTQELPYPGKLGLRAKVAATDAQAARWASFRIATVPSRMARK